ncbi:pentapeptide repeat-containing protein [Arthrobacter sedimenti]|uniref:Pentapeptide repeat-containing protein n=1 Tax=Arthrobacter sedimenti TaxID=2694931 RepID=A0ABV8WLU2_9MICC
MARPLANQAALRPDCAQCFALCCTAFGFTRSADFAIDKPPATPCPNLAADFSCTIHDRLRPRGFAGCTVFDCFGAGQAVSQRLFHGTSWRDNPGSAPDMFAAFRVLRQLHEMLWHLAQAEAVAYSPDAADEVRHLQAKVREVAEGDLGTVLTADVGSLHLQVGEALRWVSEEVRAGYLADGPQRNDLAPGADLAGANLRGSVLCGADLRGACLIAADLRGADLTAVDLLGADLRDARLDDADLSQALFLTEAQIAAARGSLSTRLPAGLKRPDHWIPSPLSPAAALPVPPSQRKRLDSPEC